MSAYAAFSETMNMLEPISDGLPYLSGVIGVASKVAATVKAAKHNKEACYKLGERINRILLAAHGKLLEREAYDMDPSMEQHINSLTQILANVDGHLMKLAKKNLIARVLRKTADMDAVADFEKTVEETVQLLIIKTQVTTGMDVRYLRNENVRRLVADMRHYGGWQDARRCLPGTRARYLARIDDWICDLNQPSVFWLNGVAGVGKSTIATEVAARLHAQGAIYSCFFFDRGAAHTASSAVQVLAFGLSFSPGLRLPITRAFESASDPRTALNLEQQFDALAVSPLSERLSAPALSGKPVVLILDALDECPRDLRAELLRGVQLAQTRLPPNVKFFLTSRVQADIAAAMKTVRASRLSLEVGTREAERDVRSFISTQLRRIREAKNLSGQWPEAHVARDVDALSERAGGLFQWARVVCTLIESRFSPRKVIDRILRLGPETEPEANLDGLYLEALRIALPKAAQDPELQSTYRIVVGFIMSVPRPPRVPLIGELFSLPEETVRQLLTDLGCVVSVDSQDKARISHPSFFDFVTDASRCSDAAFYIDPVAARRHTDNTYSVLLPRMPWCYFTRLRLSTDFLNGVARLPHHPTPLACLRDNMIYVLPLMLAAILFSADEPPFVTDSGISKLDAVREICEAYEYVWKFTDYFHSMDDFCTQSTFNLTNASCFMRDMQWTFPQPLPPSAIWLHYGVHNWRALKEEHPTCRPDRELYYHIRDLILGKVVSRSTRGTEDTGMEGWVTSGV